MQESVQTGIQISHFVKCHNIMNTISIAFIDISLISINMVLSFTTRFGELKMEFIQYVMRHNIVI